MRSVNGGDTIYFIYPSVFSGIQLPSFGQINFSFADN